MAQNTKETEKTETQTPSVSDTQKKDFKKSTLLIGVLVVGAVAIWGGVANRWINIPGISDQTVQESQEIVATVNGTPVYLSEVLDVARKTPQLAELPFDMIYPKLLNEIVNGRVFEQAAVDAGLESNPAVESEIKRFRNHILAQTYLKNKVAELATPDKLKELYIQEIKNFERPEEIHARHILVKTPKEAQDILIQLKAGADFKMLANTKSLDSESNNGGDLGYFQKNMMIADFSEPVFALKKGQISAPIKTPFGWHIVQVEDRRLVAPPAFEDVQDQLRQLFFEKNKAAIIEGERTRYKVDVKVPSLKPAPIKGEKAQAPATKDMVEVAEKKAEVSQEADEEAPVEPTAAPVAAEKASEAAPVKK